MAIVILLAYEPLVTLLIGTEERLFSGMVGHVIPQSLLVFEQFRANSALESNSNIRMFERKVNSHGLHRGELPVTLGTGEVTLATLPDGGQFLRSFNLVNDLFVPDSILVPHEEALAVITLVAFQGTLVPGVLAVPAIFVVN